MADIRIKDLAVTAGSSASDDYLAVDGATNGTRKLSAYSPTFGGNLTVSGNINYQNTAQLANTATLSSGTKLTIDTIAQQGIDIFRSDANANYSGIRFRNSANNATNAQIGWSGTSLRLEGTPVEVAGNLTVSGVLTNVLNGPAAAITTSGSGVNGTLCLTESPSSGAMLMMGTYGGNYAYVQMTNSSNLASSYPIALNPNGGNVLVGTTSDSGQKLQVSGNGIFKGVATENVSLDIGTGRSGNGNAVLDLVGDATYTDYGLRMIRGDGGANSYSAIVHRGTGIFEINCVEAASVALKTNSTTALTLDSSQNATFAGQINGNAGFQFRGATGTFYELFRYAGGSNNPGLYVRATEATGTVRLEASGSSGQFPFEIASGGTLAATFNGANATFAGSIAIGNTVNTVSPTSPNRTITMVIGGTTYYIHAKTTND